MWTPRGLCSTSVDWITAPLVVSSAGSVAGHTTSAPRTAAIAMRLIPPPKRRISTGSGALDLDVQRLVAVAGLVHRRDLLEASLLEGALGHGGRIESRLGRR